MDTLTHGLSGALVGRAFSKNVKIVTPAACIVTGALSATFPDFDFLFKIFGDNTYMWNHRGITHSFFFLPIWAGLISIFLAWIFTRSKNLEKWFKLPDTTYSKWQVFKDIYLLSALSILAHILGDLITSFGTMVFWPNMTRYEFGSVFIIDLFFTGIIVAGLLVSWKFGDNIKLKANIAIFFSMLLVSYVELTNILRDQAKNEMMIIMADKYPNINTESFLFDAKPQMFLPTNWSGIAYDNKEEKYYYAKIDLLGNNYDLKQIFEFKKWGDLNRDRAIIVFEHPEMKFARWFFQYPYVKNEDDKCVYFSDMRYMSSFRGKDPFIYGMCDNTK
jgi:inner membrane protein